MLRFLPLLLPFAADAAETAAPTVSAGTYVQAALALALILALLLGTAWLARKVSGGKGFGQGGMKIVGGVALGPRERIVLLEVGDEWLVIGIVPGQIRTLHRLEKGAAMPADGLPASAEKPFTQWLQGIAERRKND
ncbi:MAG TPA: flagellar biosynthetic protein FliO [Azonexus sp.]|nr:flagellar biosynthetic protein FliO [Azonexus sp.]